MSTRPPGDPKANRDEDSLARWRFARGVWDFVRTSPKEWPLRIGVYGGWGEGKTSVLNFIEKMAVEDGAKVAWFNPWPHQDTQKMWNALAKSIELAIAPNESSTKAKRTLSFIGQGAKKAAEAHAISRAVVGAAEAIGVGKLVEIRRSDITKIIQANLGNSRLVLMIDDLDRTDPKNLSGIFYILREVLDIPNCAFIFGMDPTVVAKSLSGVNSGWREGMAFLEKIIDFPIWLPTPNAEDQWALLARELKATKCGIPSESVKDILDLLPRNPRKLTQFARGLWRLNPIIERHSPDEIHWISLLICQLLESEFPGVLRTLAASEKVREVLSTGWLSAAMRDTEERIAEQKTTIAQFAKTFAEGSGPADPRLEKRLCDLLVAWRERSTVMSMQKLQYVLALFDEPPVMTDKEFDAFLGSFTVSPIRATIETFVDAHFQATGASKAETRKALFLRFVATRDALLGEAADSQLQDDLVNALGRAAPLLSGIRILAIDEGGFSGESAFLDLSCFEEVLRMAAKWAHFRRPDTYIATRDAEATLIRDIAPVLRSIAPRVLESLQPWNVFGHDENEEYRKPLLLSVQGPVSDATADEVLERMARPDGVAALRGRDQHVAEKFILFSADSPIFKEARRKRFLDIATLAATKIEVQRNFIDLVSMISDGLGTGVTPVGRDDIRKLVADRDLILAIWAASVAREVQFRMMGSLIEDLERLEGILGKGVLVSPPWVEAAKKERMKQATAAQGKAAPEEAKPVAPMDGGKDVKPVTPNPQSGS